MALTRKQRERSRGVRRENRHERRQQQHAGGSEWDCIRVPEGLKVFKPEAGKTYHIDVIPYIVGDRNRNAEKGDEYFELSYAVYNGIGLENKRFVAIGEMFGVADPVVEHFAMLRKQGAEWEDMKIFKPTWRQIFLVFVHEESENGLQLFEGAYGMFGELLDEELVGEESDYIDNFDDPEHGSTLEARFKAKNIGKAKPWILASKINFIEREDGFIANGNKKLAASILDQASEICLDNCLKLADYDTLKAVLDGRPSGAAETEDPQEEKKETKRQGRSSTNKTKKKEPETPSEDDDDWEFPEEPQNGDKKGKDKEKEEQELEEDDPPFNTDESDKEQEKDSGNAGSDDEWDEDW